jgi:hypothetical protein
MLTILGASSQWTYSTFGLVRMTTRARSWVWSLSLGKLLRLPLALNALVKSAWGMMCYLLCVLNAALGRRVPGWYRETVTLRRQASGR